MVEAALADGVVGRAIAGGVLDLQIHDLRDYTTDRHRVVVGEERAVPRDTCARGLLDFPQYTRPAEFRGMRVPPVLLSGHHGEIDRWRRREALARTLAQRPDMLERAALDAEDEALLKELR